MAEDRVAANSDELLRMMEEDELEDRLEGQLKMSPREYAVYRSKLTGMKIAPQLIYYYIRNRKIELEQCVCGRPVIDVEAADAFFAERDKK